MNPAADLIERINSDRITTGVLVTDHLWPRLIEICELVKGPVSAEVVSTDYVGTLLDRGGERAKAEHLPVTFQLADAENLPFADASFDVVLSAFGVMFTPDQERAAQELLRVCRPGGKIGLANWTPESFIGRVFKTIGKYVPPAPSVKSPALWGTRGHLELLFGSNATIAAESRNFNFRCSAAVLTTLKPSRFPSSVNSSSSPPQMTRPSGETRRYR